MKNLKQLYSNFEQEILFVSLIAYLTGMILLFNYGVDHEWKGLLWIVQFLVLGSLLFLRGKQKNWKWPRRP